jgi:hypothetical protein
MYTQNFFMKKMILLTCIILSIGITKTTAQTLVNTSWKGFFGDPINDTLTIHYQKDTFYVTNKGGDMLVRSTLKISKDTMTINDFDGQYMCPQSEGVYKYTINGDNLSFTLVSDACDGRNAIATIKWVRVAGTGMK